MWLYGAPCCCTGSEPHRRSLCDLFVVSMSWFVAFFYIWLTNQAGSQPFGIDIFWSPVGKSTCSSSTLQDVWAYNAASVFKFTAHASSADVQSSLRLPFQSCVFTLGNEFTRWGDLSENPIPAFQAGSTPCVADTSNPCSGSGCADLPSTDPKYWIANPGKGLASGMWPGVHLDSGCRSVASDSTACPYVSNKRGPYNCPLCLGFWRDNNLVPTPDPTLASCPASLYTKTPWACVMCPGANFAEPTDGANLAKGAETLFVCSIITTCSAIVTFLCRSQQDDEGGNTQKKD